MKPEFPPGLSQSEIEKLKRKQISNSEKLQNGSSKKKKNRKKGTQDNNNSSKENTVESEQESSLDTLEKGMLALDIRGQDIPTDLPEDNGTEKVHHSDGNSTAIEYRIQNNNFSKAKNPILSPNTLCLKASMWIFFF